MIRATLVLILVLTLCGAAAGTAEMLTPASGPLQAIVTANVSGSLAVAAARGCPSGSTALTYAGGSTVRGGGGESTSGGAVTGSRGVIGGTYINAMPAAAPASSDGGTPSSTTCVNSGAGAAPLPGSGHGEQ